MEVIDISGPAEHRRLKALVYGKSGTGKTGFGVSAPAPLILLNERQAIPHIVSHAKRLGRAPIGVLVMKSVEDYRDVLRALHGDRSKPFVVRTKVTDEQLGDVTLEAFRSDVWPESIVLDSLTEACELIAEEIRDQSPPKMGKDGLPVDSERYWNVFGDRAGKLIRAFRDVDMNVLYLCLLDDRTTGEDEAKVRWVGPQLTMRRLPGIVQAAVNVVGVTRRTMNADKSSTYGIVTVGPSYMELKPFPPLRPAEVMDFTSWVARVNGTDDGSKAPEVDRDEETAAPKPADTKTAPAKKAAAAKKTDMPKTGDVIIDAAVARPQTAPTAQEAQT